MVPEAVKAPRIPLATYRLQFNRSFTFSQAADLIPYLAALGISHCYSSPYLRARLGSTHGYDIIDHQHLNPEIGAPEEYDRFVAALHQHGMGQILDIVPNHMGIMGGDNAWWLDVLENGEASTYSGYFDIDWEPLKEELRGKVLVAVLGDQYGTVLDRGELKLTFNQKKGEFSILYFQHRFPVNPREYPRILSHDLESLSQQLGALDEKFLELQSVISGFNHLPGREEKAAEKRAERMRDKEIHKRRLAALCERSAQVAGFIENNVASVNGTSGDSVSWEALHELIKAQAYRLAYWRVAADDINYRRFFDVNDLAAVRQENQPAFTQTHEFVLQLLRQGQVDGLRIDHPDGLYNPHDYLQDLQGIPHSPDGAADSGGHYVLVEKILTGDEELPRSWPISGTTGYEFSNLVNALFVDPNAENKMDRIYRAFIGRNVDFQELVYQCKKLVMDRSLNSELNVLANHLSRIALADRHTCDFTVKSLRDALTEIIAAFPVYRTYVAGRHVAPDDRKYIDTAIHRAQARMKTADSSVYDFIREILLTRQADGHQTFYQESVVHFAMKFQQYTSALMAKGLEDTSFYRYNRLISLNDVGGDPLQFGVSPEEFHRKIQLRAETWPHSMNSTSTHDSKRSEDTRARINVLSEMPALWRQHLAHCRSLNRKEKTVCDGAEAPTSNDEYLLYQTLLGAWPLPPRRESPPPDFVDRIRDYMLKAIREAKENTSWANPNLEYESAMSAFVNAVLNSRDFRDHFLPFQARISHFGMLNSLAQTLLKVTVPGVPDIYQGNELFEFDLVDPDNRRRVDYAVRHRALQDLGSSQNNPGDFPDGDLPTHMHMDDGRIKLCVIWKALQLRKRKPQLFGGGEYLPLQVSGDRARHLLAFARLHKNEVAVVAVPRLCAQLLGGEQRLPVGAGVWGDTCIDLPNDVNSLRNVFTGESVKLSGDTPSLPVASLFATFPVALLTN